MRPVFLILAAAELAMLLTFSAPHDPDKPGIAGGIRTAAAQLRGAGPPIDFVQDYVGARVLAREGDPYGILTDAYASVGIAWIAPHRSTHPPTAFLLALPVAWLSYNLAAAVWGVAMLAAIGGAWWAFGVRWEVAAALAPLTVLWPPAAWSLGQLTPLWLLGLALAWRFRDRPVAAGAAIGLASLTKLVPALSLAPFLLRGRWTVLRGFAAVWALALALLQLLDLSVISRYLTIGRTVSREQVSRAENSALLFAAWHGAGVVGLGAALVLVGAVVVLSVKRLRATGRLNRWSWDAWSWLGVALLPIAWIYSLLPLLPALVRVVARGGPLAAALALFTLLVPFLVEPFGLPGAAWMATATACFGLSLLVAAAWPATAVRVRKRISRAGGSR